MTALSGLSEVAGLRQDHRDLQRLGLRPDDGGHGEKRRAGGGAAEKPAAAESVVVGWHQDFLPGRPPFRVAWLLRRWRNPDPDRVQTCGRQLLFADYRVAPSSPQVITSETA